MKSIAFIVSLYSKGQPMKSFIAFIFAAFFAGSALAQDQTQQTPPDAPPQGWYQQQSHTTDNLGRVFFFSKDSGWVVVYGSLMFSTINGGANWVQCQTLPQGWVPFLFLDYNTGFAYLGDSIIKTIDAGVTWSKPKNANLQGYLISTSVGKDTIFIVAHGLFFSSDRGETWNPTLPQEPGVLYPNNISFSDSKHGWVIGGEQPYPPNPNLPVAAGIGLTIDGGQTWTHPYSGIESGISAMYAFDSLNLIAGGIYMYLSTDGGFHWQKDSAKILSFAKIFFLNRRVGYECGGAGEIAVTHDTGKTWMFQSTGILNDLTDIVFVDSAKGWSVGYNGMILHTENGGVSWVKQFLPFDSVMTQNYPEPSTTSYLSIHYTIPSPQHVSLTLYNLTGNQVQIFLQNDYEVQGEHTIPVMLLPELANGTYYYIFQTEKYQSTGKITILR
jgi:photosystem II stability/assembly factor-like uncharacterized protein